MTTNENPLVGAAAPSLRLRVNHGEVAVTP
jgi:hypothetical protein